MDQARMGALVDSEHCKELANVDFVNFVLSWLILVGILVSYLPQHYRIIHRRSSEGLSPYFVLLGTTSGTCAIANILVLPTSRLDIGCCKVNSAFSCMAGLLGVAQVGIQWSCFFLITLLFLIFIPRHNLQHRVRLVDPLVPTDAAWHEALGVVGVAILHFLAVFIVSVIMLGAYPKQLQGWANTLGTMGAMLASIQYMPQIYTTWHRKHIGSLSIPMMCIQTPGSAVFAYSLYARLGPSGWSAWTVYLVTGSLQGILLFLAYTYDRRDRKARAAGSTGSPDDEFPPSDETDALLRHNSRAASHRRALLQSGGSPFDPSKPPVHSDPSPDPDDESGYSQTVNSLRGSGSRHSFANVANNVAAYFGIGQVPREDSFPDEPYFDEPAAPAEATPRSSQTLYYDAHSRRDSQESADSAGSYETVKGPSFPRTADNGEVVSAGIATVGSESEPEGEPQSGAGQGGRPLAAERRAPNNYPDAVRTARGLSRVQGQGREAATERLCRTPRAHEAESSAQARRKGKSAA